MAVLNAKKTSHGGKLVSAAAFLLQKSVRRPSISGVPCPPRVQGTVRPGHSPARRNEFDRCQIAEARSTP